MRNLACLGGGVVRDALLLVDLSAIFWWKWHAAAGQPVDTAFEFTVGKVRQLASGFSHVAVCCDAGRSFRYEIDASYKSKRPPRDEAAVAQLGRVCKALRAAGFVLLEAEGFEADDVVATVVGWAAKQEPPAEIVIAGQDKDLLQLVSERVSFLAVQSGALVRPEAVRSKYGVGPEQMRDFLALVGDSSDNIKGVPKIGPENAKRLLGEFGSAHELVKILGDKNEDGSWKVTPDSIRESLLANIATLSHAMSLVSLRTDVPILEALGDLDRLSTKHLKSGEANEPRKTSPSSPSSPPSPPARPAPERRAPEPQRDEPRGARPDEKGSEVLTALGLVKAALPYFAQSEQLDQLAAALSRAQGQIQHAERDSENPHLKNRYADLASVIDACRGSLAANGLAVVQLPWITERGYVLRTRLLHSSGQWIESEAPVLATRQGPQEYGAALTYARRYSLAAMVGVAPDNDDDGELAEGRGQGKRTPAAAGQRR